jgi:predicted glycosyltransferase involved in capsule biosynthesis
MFARLLELTVKAEKKPELFSKIEQDVLPILRKYTGFREIVNMEVESEPTKVYLISLWNQKTDAEKYDKENFPKVKAMYEPFLTMPISVKLCKVDDTTFKKMSSVAA